MYLLFMSDSQLWIGQLLKVQTKAQVNKQIEIYEGGKNGPLPDNTSTVN